MELVSIRDRFARKLVFQINGMVLRFYDQLIRIAPGSGGAGGGGVSSDKSHRYLGGAAGSIMNLSSSRSTLSTTAATTNPSTALAHCLELQVAQRSEMVQLSPLVGGWLQTNRHDMFRDLKKVRATKHSEHLLAT